MFVCLLCAKMIRSGIPGVNANAPKHIQRVLLPDRTDVEAVAEFTRVEFMEITTTRFINSRSLSFQAVDFQYILSFAFLTLLDPSTTNFMALIDCCADVPLSTVQTDKSTVGNATCNMV